MATAPLTLYDDLDAQPEFKLTGADQTPHQNTDGALGMVTTFAGAAIAVAAVNGLTGASLEKVEEYEFRSASVDYFVDERSLLIDELREYEFLESGWDGSEDDVAPSRVAVDEAIQFVENLPSFVDLPEPMVSSDGEVGLFWNSAELYLDVGFRGCGTCSYYGSLGEDMRVKNRYSVSKSEPIPSELVRFFAAIPGDGKVYV